MAFLAYPVFVVGAAMGTSLAALGFYTCATEDEEEEYFQRRPASTTTTTIFNSAATAPAPAPASPRDLEVERLVVDESIASANADEQRRRHYRDSFRREEELTRMRSLAESAPRRREPRLLVTAHCASQLDASWFERRSAPVVAHCHLYDRHGDFVETSTSRPSDGGDVARPVWSRGAVRLDAVLRRADLRSVQLVVELARGDSGETLGRTEFLRLSDLCDGTPRDLRLAESLGVLTASFDFQDDAPVEGRVVAPSAVAPSAPAEARPPPRNPFVEEDDRAPVAALPASSAGLTDAVALPLADATLPVASFDDGPVQAHAAPAWLAEPAAAVARPVRDSEGFG